MYTDDEAHFGCPVEIKIIYLSLLSEVYWAIQKKNGHDWRTERWSFTKTTPFHKLTRHNGENRRNYVSN